MQRTSVPRSQASSASASSLSNALLSAFSASGRFKVAMPTEPLISVLMFMRVSCLAFGTIEGRTARLHNAFYRPGTFGGFAGQALAAIDQEMMLEIARIAGGLGIVAQGRAPGRDCIRQHFLDRRHQFGQAVALDRACQPLGRRSEERRV